MMGNVDQKHLYQLIEDITPLNNRYRDLVKSGASGNAVLHIMWQVGSMLASFIEAHNVKPHALYWQIYGKAEGIKTSYITRDFLSYCLRIKKFFKSEETIDTLFPHLQRYSLFREAFPLLENPKYKLSDNEEQNILKILNSSSDPQKIKDYLVNIKTKRIGISNTRTQRLSEVQPYAENFKNVYNEVFNLIKSNNDRDIDRFKKMLGTDHLKTLSESIAALTQENLFVPELSTNSDLSPTWSAFVSNLQKLHAGTIESRNRFRRIVRPAKLFALADMLNAFTIENGVDNYRKRKGDIYG